MMAPSLRRGSETPRVGAGGAAGKCARDTACFGVVDVGHAHCPAVHLRCGRVVVGWEGEGRATAVSGV